VNFFPRPLASQRICAAERFTNFVAAPATRARCCFSATVDDATLLGAWRVAAENRWATPPHLGAGALNGQPRERQSLFANGQAGLRGIECEVTKAMQVEINIIPVLFASRYLIKSTMRPRQLLQF
jgi:hypothetical protein